MTESDARWFLERGYAQSWGGDWYIAHVDGDGLEWFRVNEQDADQFERLSS